ncbi:MAG TPA: DUF192 domain-containing protein [Candidatus Saccharimonadales bacterium]|nr:DUF192 domain-containing protein [Candidatus Saccharimonadales bacterium]
MPNNAIAKTAWAPRKRLVVTLAALAALLVCAGLYARHHQKYTHIGSHAFVTEVASTPAAQQQGLSERTSFSSRQAMLFSYNRPQQLCFWMKDMYFSLDILWMDASHRVISMQQNVSPKTYPQQFCAQAQYVLEIRAGQAKASGAHIGQQIDF